MMVGSDGNVTPADLPGLKIGLADFAFFIPSPYNPPNFQNGGEDLIELSLTAAYKSLGPILNADNFVDNRYSYFYFPSNTNYKHSWQFSMDNTRGQLFANAFVNAINSRPDTIQDGTTIKEIYLSIVSRINGKIYAGTHGTYRVAVIVSISKNNGVWSLNSFSIGANSPRVYPSTDAELMLIASKYDLNE